MGVGLDAVGGAADLVEDGFRCAPEVQRGDLNRLARVPDLVRLWFALAGGVDQQARGQIGRRRKTASATSEPCSKMDIAGTPQTSRTMFPPPGVSGAMRGRNVYATGMKGSWKAVAFVTTRGDGSSQRSSQSSGDGS